MTNPTPRGFTRKQYQRMTTPVKADKLETKQNMTYVPAFEVKAELGRTFGMGNWDSEVIELVFLYEEKVMMGKEKNKEGWEVAYRCGVRLRVRDYWGNEMYNAVEYHAESAILPFRGEAHAMAITSVESYALRRAALALGDNFGLHLYDKGSREPLIRGTLAVTEHLADQEHAEGKHWDGRLGRYVPYVEPALTPPEQPGTAALPAEQGVPGGDGPAQPSEAAQGSLASAFEHPQQKG
jgi:hypothetical protein